jgi:hypothetical protein
MSTILIIWICIDHCPADDPLDPAKVNGEIVRVPQRVLFIQQLIKAGITGGAPAKKLVLQFTEQHEFGEARRRSQTWFGVPDCGTVWLRPFPRTLLIGVSALMLKSH